MDIKSALKHLSILYIEDEKDIRVNIVKTLKYVCRDIYEAENPIEGMKLYEKYKPDIILTDVNMPQMDGIEFVKMVREKDLKTPIIVITAYKDEHYLMEAIKLHLEDYIVKPFVYSDLIEILYKCTKKIIENGRFQVEFLNGSIFDFNKNIIYQNETELTLSKKEILLLKLLIDRVGGIVTYEEIEENLWIDEAMSKGALKTLVSKLRQKVGNETIIAQSGIGYKLIL